MKVLMVAIAVGVTMFASGCSNNEQKQQAKQAMEMRDQMAQQTTADGDGGGGAISSGDLIGTWVMAGVDEAFFEITEDRFFSLDDGKRDDDGIEYKIEDGVIKFCSGEGVTAGQCVANPMGLALVNGNLTMGRMTFSRKN
jgi:uncharacterized protein YceK